MHINVGTYKAAAHSPVLLPCSVSVPHKLVFPLVFVVSVVPPTLVVGVCAHLHWWLMSVPPHIGGQWLCLLTLVVIVYALLHWWSVCTQCSCLLLSGGQCGPVCCSVMPPFHLWSVGAFLFTWSVGSVGRRGRKRTSRKRWWRRNKRALECKHKFCLCVWFAISGLKAHSHSDGLSAFCCHPLFNDNRSQALCTGTCDSWHRT